MEKKNLNMGELFIVQMKEKLKRRGKWRQAADGKGKSRENPASVLQVRKSDKTT